MANGPIDGLIFAHTAIEGEVRRIERLAAEASAPEQAAALEADVKFVRNFIFKHTDGEELGLYPTLVAKVPNVDATYLFDHADDKQQFADLEGLLGRCRTEADGKALTALRRQTVVVTEHLALHIRKENELVLPLIGKTFSPPEQGAMVQQILSVFTPAEMAAVVPFITRMQGDADAVAYVKVLAAVMPPPVFEKAAGWIHGGVDAGRWALLAAAIPALAPAG